MFIGGSMNPEYFKSKVNLFVALAPVARVGHVKSTFLKIIASDVDRIERIMIDDFGLYNSMAPNWLKEKSMNAFCTVFSLLCDAIASFYGKLQGDVDNMDRVKTYLTHFPAGAGYRNSVHYCQIINANRFQRYDWGPTNNVEKYGTATPPLYPLEHI